MGSPADTWKELLAVGGYEGRYRSLGIKAWSELPRYFSQASFFVIASIQEGLALVQAQAMASRLPVIATTNTGATDLFTDGVECFIVPIRDPAAIREKVLYLCEHPEAREEMGRAALRRVASLGAWGSYGEAW
ncbi:MAG TPA: glycosyltransferase family 4 protein [Gemmatimonadales bacterium]|nr:glycosyltransferase family 4 protein [Gemmatimonadales bacterium]